MSNLTQEEIIEGNKLIAEFMNYNDVDCSYCKNNYDCNHIQCGLSKEEKEELLQYHTSWDWLMGVVEKIEATLSDDGYRPVVTIHTTFVRIKAIGFETEIKHV